MYKVVLAIIFLVTVASAAVNLTPSTFITDTDKAHLKNVFKQAEPFQDVASLHYAVLGTKLLGETVADEKGKCVFLQSKLQGANVEALFHISGAAKALTGCKISVPAPGQQSLTAILTDDSAATVDIYYSVLALKNLNLPVDSAKVLKSLTAALKKDDSVINLGYAFHVGSELSGDVTSLFDRIEDAIVQADEVDEKFAQFEGGLSITATIISGVYKLAEKVGKAPAIDADKCLKFTGYFLSRRHVQLVRAAYHLTDVLSILTKNKFHIPVAVTIASKPAVSNKEPNVQIRYTNILGGSLGPLTATLETATRKEDNKVVATKKPLKAVQGDGTLYTINLMESKPSRGVYQLTLSGVPSKADPRLLGNKNAVLNVKVMTEIDVLNAEIGTVELDQATAPKLSKVVFPKKLDSSLEADHHQKVIMKFTLQDRNAQGAMTVHQAFVSLTNAANKQEIIFVAEADSSNNYRFDMDVNGRAKDFGYQSGRYTVQLIVGDAVISNPFAWHVADLDLSFPSEGPVQSQSKTNLYSAKPEIKHLFREPEKRPSPLVSNTFTLLVLSPILLLLILWFKIGINVSNFKFNLGTVGFHIGLASIFGLLICFWLQLNMFTTLKYLLGLGVVTFLCGNSMLSQMSNTRKQKEAVLLQKRSKTYNR